MWIYELVVTDLDVICELMMVYLMMVYLTIGD